MSPDLSEFLRLAPLGVLVGAFGTLVGAGGGSVLVPLLLIMLPHESPASITAISLAVVFFNAYSGTIAYVRMGRIDYRAGTAFILASLPGAILGTLLVHDLPRQLFDPVFGILLFGTGLLLILFPVGSATHEHEHQPHVMSSRDLLKGTVGSSYIAVLSSLLGIGGGIIHVPFLIRSLNVPPHTATATSHFVLTFVALTATVTHVTMGQFNHGLSETLCLSIGVMMGAPLGAMLSTKLRGSLIVRILAGALCLVGLRLLGRAL